MSRPHISLVTLLWRNEQYVNSFLETVPDGVDIERIAVVNGPEGDRAGEALVSHAKGSAWRLVRLDENSGFSGGANAGVSMARGRIVILANLDLRFAPDFFTRLLDGQLEAWDVAVPGVHAWGSGFNDLIDGPVARKWHHRHVMLEPVPVAGSYLTAGTGCCFVLKSAVISARLDANGSLFDPEFHSFAEDLDLFWWASKRGERIRFFPSLRVEHAWAGSFGGRYRYVDREEAIKLRVMTNYRLAAAKNVTTLQEMGGWVAGELIAIARALRADGVRGVVLYFRSWPRFVRSVAGIRRRRGHLRVPRNTQ